MPASFSLTESQVRAGEILQDLIDGGEALSVLKSQADTAAAPGTVSVGTNATEILAANTGRLQGVIRNTDASATLYLGYSDAITTANAPIELSPGESFIEDIATTAIYGIVSSGTVAAAHQELT